MADNPKEELNRKEPQAESEAEALSAEDLEDLKPADEAEAWLLAPGSTPLTNLANLGIIGGTDSHGAEPLSPDDPLPESKATIKARADQAEKELQAADWKKMNHIGGVGIVGGIAAPENKPVSPDDPNFLEWREKRLREMGSRCLNDDGVTGIGIIGGLPPKREEDGS